MKPLFIPINREYLKYFDWWHACHLFQDIDFLIEHEDKLVWETLSTNMAAVEYLEKNQDKIWWNKLSSNKNPKAISLLRENIDKLITGSKFDCLKLFENETKEAAELSKEILVNFKPGGKYYFISNKDCSSCQDVAGVSKCPDCVRRNWISISSNKYMISLIEEFVRSKEFKDFFWVRKGYENFQHEMQIKFMGKLATNSAITPYLISEITNFFWFCVDKINDTTIKWDQKYEGTAPPTVRILDPFFQGFIEGKNKKLIEVTKDYLKNTTSRECIFQIVDKAVFYDAIDEFIDVIEKEEFLFTDIYNSSYAYNDYNGYNDIVSRFWFTLSCVHDPRIIAIFNKNIEFINKLDSFNPHREIWYELSSNPFAISLLYRFPQHVQYYNALQNPNKEIIFFLMKNFEKIPWEEIVENYPILDLDKYYTNKEKTTIRNNENPYDDNDSINSETTSLSEEEEETHYINNLIFPEQNRFENEYTSGLNFIKNVKSLYNRGFKNETMRRILYEVNSIEFLQNNFHCINPNCVIDYKDCMIRAIYYKLDYENMRKNNAIFNEELMSYVFNPERISRFAKQYNVEFMDIINTLD